MLWVAASGTCRSYLGAPGEKDEGVWLRFDVLIAGDELLDVHLALHYLTRWLKAGGLALGETEGGLVGLAVSMYDPPT